MSPGEFAAYRVVGHPEVRSDLAKCSGFSVVESVAQTDNLGCPCGQLGQGGLDGQPQLRVGGEVRLVGAVGQVRRRSDGEYLAQAGNGLRAQVKSGSDLGVGLRWRLGGMSDGSQITESMGRNCDRMIARRDGPLLLLADPGDRVRPERRTPASTEPPQRLQESDSCGLFEVVSMESPRTPPRRADKQRHVGLDQELNQFRGQWLCITPLLRRLPLLDQAALCALNEVPPHRLGPRQRTIWSGWRPTLRRATQCPVPARSWALSGPDCRDCRDGAVAATGRAGGHGHGRDGTDSTTHPPENSVPPPMMTTEHEPEHQRRTAARRDPHSRAPYDDIADWYEHEFLPRDFDPDRDPIGIADALRHVLGPGEGPLLEIGCGTGIHAGALRLLGWSPIGLDLSAGMLRYAHDRLPVAQGDATVLPFPDHCVPAVLAAMVHTDMADYTAVLREAHRVLAPRGVFVHIGVHPCFCGGFADRSDPSTVIIKPGYLDSNWTTVSYTDQGIRDKLGAEHRPLAWLLNSLIDVGLIIEQVAEGGTPTPTTLTIKARKGSP